MALQRPVRFNRINRRKFLNTMREEFIPQNTDYKEDLDIKLCDACYEGDIEAVKLCLINGEGSLGWGLRGACRKEGNIEIVKLLVEYHTNTNNMNNSDRIKYLNWGLSSACAGNNLEIVKYLVDNGADNFDDGLLATCFKGTCETADFLVKCGASKFEKCLAQACHEGHLEIAKFMIAKKATNWNEGLLNACHGGRIELVALMLDYGATNLSESLADYMNGYFTYIIDPEIINLLLSRGAMELV